MQSKMYNDAKIFDERHQNRRRWYTVLVVMAAIVVFCTTYALIMPAITMEQETFCGLSEHTHSDECYIVDEKTGEKILSCGLEEHIHNDDCVNEELFAETEDSPVETADTADSADSADSQKAPKVAKAAVNTVAVGDPDEVLGSGTCGTNLVWTLTGDGKLTISGTGSMSYFSSYSNVPWYNKRDSITSVYIDAGVGSLSQYAFYRYTNLQSVEFAESSVCTSIGDSAFNGCSALTDITIPASVKSIGDRVFYTCSSLQSVKFADGSECTSIGQYVFHSCIALKEITMSASVESIGNYAFHSCGALKEITIPASVESIGTNAFYNCTGLQSVNFAEGSKCKSTGTNVFYNCSALTEITIPASVESIGDNTFSACANLQSVKFAEGSKCTSIRQYAFYNCSSLTELTLPAGVTTIETGLFSGCSALTEITIPASIESIGTYAFNNCTSLQSVEFAEGSACESIGDRAFAQCNALAEITIPAGVVSIGNYAFDYCKSLKSVEFEEGSVCATISNYAFEYCSALTEITIPASVKSIGTYAFRGCTTMQSVNFAKGSICASIGESAFNGCTLLKNVNLEECRELKSIQTYTFYNCSNLQSVNLAALSELTTIGTNAFYNCDAIKEIVIPASVTTIDTSAFYSCDALQIVEFSEESALTSIGTNAFYQCTKLQNINLEECNSLTNIGNSAFSGCSSLPKITIPDSVTSIGNYAFYNCSSLTGKITIPDGITSIEFNTFYGCRSLTEITIPDSVTSIGAYAFYNCSSLNGKITIPDGVTSIGRYTFYGCRSLTEVTIPNSVTNIEVSAFYSCQSLTKMIIPDSVTNIGSSAFSNCTSLQVISLPSGLTIIEPDTFSGCSSLTQITIPDGVTSIGQSAFSLCSSLQGVTIPSGVTNIGSSAFYYVRDISFENNSNLSSALSSSLFTNVSSKIDRLSAAAALTSNTVNNNLSTVTVEINDACSGITSDNVSPYFKNLYITQIIVSDNVKTVNADLLYWFASSNNAELVFDEGAKFKLVGDFLPHNNRYPALSEGEYYAGKNSVLYRIGEDGKAYLAYCPPTLNKLSVPAKIGEYDIVGVDTAAFNTARSVTEVTFESPESITTIAPYAFANAVNLEKVNGAGSESGIKDIFTKSSDFGFLAFYNTKITQNENTQFKLNTDELAPDDYLKVFTEFKSLPIRPQEENTCYTGQSATTTISLTNPMNTGSESSGYNVYFWFLKSNGSLNFNTGDYLLLYDVEGSESKGECYVRVDELNIPGLYCFNIPALEPGATLTFDVTSTVASPGMSGDNLLVWCEKALGDNISGDVVTVPNNYQCVEWIVHPEDFNVTASITNNGYFISDESGKSYSLKYEYVTIASKIDGSTINGVGEDFVKSIEYLNTFKLSDGMHWNQDVIDALNNGDWIVEYPTNSYVDIDSSTGTATNGRRGVIYVYVNGVKTQIAFVHSDYIGYCPEVKDVYVKDNNLCINFSYENTKSTQQNANGTIGQEIANLSTNIQVSSNVIMVDDELIKSQDTTTNLVVSGEVAQTIHYTYSEDKTTNADYQRSHKLSAARFGLSKTTQYSASNLGYRNSYYITASNTGTYAYNDLKYIVDPLSDLLYITPTNLEEMFFGTGVSGKYGEFLTVIIKNADLCDPLTGDTAVIGADGEQHNVQIGNTANDTPHDGMERNSPPDDIDHSVHTTDNTITLTYSDGGFKITVTDKDSNIVDDYDNKQYDAGQINDVFEALGFIVTDTTQYTVRWEMSDEAKILKGNESRSYYVNSTLKNSFMIISEDKRRVWYENDTNTTKVLPTNNAYAYGSSLCPTYPEDDNYSNTPYDRVASASGRSISKEASIYNDYSVDGVSFSDDSSLSVSIDDVVDYSVKFTYVNYNYTGYNAYDVVPLVDRLNGAQVLLVPVAGNENCEWVNDDIIVYTDSDGAEYYILNKEGTYSNVKIGGYIADRIEIKQKTDGTGLETLIYWYMTNRSMTDTYINLKALVSLQYAGVTSGGTFTMTNESWLGDHQHHRLWDTVGFEASDTKFAKNIVTSKGSTPESDKLETFSYFNEGQDVMYRLDIIPTGSPRLRTLNANNIYDELPVSVGSHKWTKKDISDICFVGTDGTPYTSVLVDGNQVTALVAGDNWKVSDTYPGMTDSTSPNQQYIIWDDNFELTLYDEPIYIYVTLKIPSGSDWNEYCNAYANQQITNRLYVNGSASTVYHEVAIPGEAFLNKGVVETGYYSSSFSSSYYKYRNLSEKSRVYYSNSDMVGRYAAYYISLYNSGKAKLYIDDIIDILPPGFTFNAVISNFYTNYTYATSTSNVNTSYYKSIVDITPSGEEAVSYAVATISGSTTRLEDGRQQVSFSVSPYNATGYTCVAYDENVGKCYLKPGEALVFAFICDIGDAEITEDVAVNNVAMKYFDYNNAGIKLSEGVDVDGKDNGYFGDITTIKNDGEGYLYDYGQATSKGFTGGDPNTKWLASSITLKRDNIVPGITKNVNKVTTSSGSAGSTSYAQFSDTIMWEVTATNDGDYHLSDYTITDVMQYPFRFTGDVSMSYDYPNYRDIPEFKLLIFDKWSDDGNSVQVKTSDVVGAGNTYTLTLNDSNWVTVQHAAILNYDSRTFEFGVRISQDSNQNFVLEFNMSDNRLSIPEGGNVKLKFSTNKPDKIGDITTPQENKVYYNNVYITPNAQQYDTNMVTRGDTVTYNEKPSVHNVAQIFVSYGNVTTSVKNIEQTDNPSNNATSSAIDKNYIVVPSSETGITYTLKVRSESSALRKLILIDNLPEVGDHETYDINSPRYSAFTVNLAANPNFKIGIDYKDGKHIDLADDDYVLEYSDKTQFDTNDRRGGGSDWYSEPKETTRSFRIIIVDTADKADDNKLMAASADISIRFDAEIEGDPEPGLIAWNSFGYNYNSYLTDNTESYLEAAPLKVGVGIPIVPFIQKTLEDDVGNIWQAEEDTQFKFIVYKGEPIENIGSLTNESEIAAKLEGRDYTYFDLMVKSGDSESEQVRIDKNLYSYHNGWVDTGNMFEWQNGERYNILELPLNDSDYKYGNIGGASGNSYTFVYHNDRSIYITATNLRKLWQLSVLKTDDSDKLLSGAVFGLYSPNKEDMLSDDKVNELVDTLGLYESPDMTFKQGMTIYYLKGIDKTSSKGIVYWTTLKEDDYLIVELQAPDGYLKSDELYKASNSDFEPIAVKVVNKALIYELPSSGGFELYTYIFGGLLTLTVILLLYRKLRSRKEEIPL